MLQQYLPLAVLKLLKEDLEEYLERKVATVLTACGIETDLDSGKIITRQFCKLQQYLPLAVLKLQPICELYITRYRLQQYLPLAVLKRVSMPIRQ